MKPALNIPEGHFPALIALARLSDDEFSAFLSGLSIAKPCRTQRELIRQLQLAHPDLKPGRLRPVVNFIVSLYSFRDDAEIPPEAFLQALDAGVDEAMQSTEQEPKVAEKIKTRLSELLHLGGVLQFLSHAADVSSDHDKSFSSARILTDLRPVFGGDISAAPAGFSLLHTLKVVFDEDFSTKEFFVVLTSDELDELDQCVQRAKRKEEQLRSLLELKELQIIQ